MRCRSHTAVRRRPRLVVATACESLERRTLLSTLVVSGTAGDDTITLDVTPQGGVETVVNGVKQDYAPNQWDAVEVGSGTGNDTINVKATVVSTTLRYLQFATINVGDEHGVQDIKANLTADGSAPGPLAGGNAALTLDDTGDSAARDISLAFAPVDLETVTGLAPAQIDFGARFALASPAPSAQGSDSLDIVTGPGDDTVRVDAIRAGMPTDIRNSGGQDAVKIGAGSLAYIQSEITVGGFLPMPVGSTTLTIDDSADPSSASFTLDAFYPPGPGAFGTVVYQAPSSSVTLQTIRFHAAETKSLTVKGGAAGNTFAVNQIIVPTVLEAGSGNDSVTVNATSAALDIHGGGGDDTVVIPTLSTNIAGNITFDGGPNGPAGDTIAFGAPKATPITAGTAPPPPPIILTAGKASSSGSDTVAYSNVEHLALRGGSFRAEADLGPLDVIVGLPTVDVIYTPPADLLVDASQKLSGLEVFSGSVTVGPGGGKVLNADNLTIGLATLDLTNNTLQLHYGAADPFQQVRGLIFAHRITSSLDDDLHNLGYADSADHVVKGLADNTVLVKYALDGDTNLDGKVDFTDLVRLARNYGRHDANWDDGDFNYDGTVGFDDLVKLARNYGRTLEA